MLKFNRTYTDSHLVSFIDYTSLNDTRDDDIEQMVKHVNSTHLKPASICTWAEHLSKLTPLKNVKKTIVLNFPNGDNSYELLEKEIKECLKHNADEIDYVIDWKSWVAHKNHLTMSHFEHFIKLTNGLFTTKVILESGEIKNKNILKSLCLDLLSDGCIDYLKTSTGKTTTGATIDDVEIILDSIQETQSNCGIKISGGIKTKEIATDFINVITNRMTEKWVDEKFRIGTSGLYTKLIGINNSKSKY